jgi:hypothetical protein
MANALYDKGRQAFLEGSIAWLTDNIKAALVNIQGGHYTVNLAADQFLSAISAGDRVAISANLTTKTSAAGVADADDVTWAAVVGAQCGAIVLFKDTGVPATSPLIAYIDTDTGLPVTPSGGDIIQVWDNAANKIFKL